jgi:hypothetical protein
VRYHCDSPCKYFEADKSMIGFLVDNIDVVFGDHVFQPSVGILMGIKSVSLSADLHSYLCEAAFIHKLLRNKYKKVAVSFNYAYR